MTTDEPRVRQRPNGGSERAASGRVHAARRFVEQGQGRSPGQGRGQGGALPLAGTQVARVPVVQAGQTERGHDRLRGAGSWGSGGAAPAAGLGRPRRSVSSTSARTVGRWSSAPGFCGRYAVRPAGRRTVPASGGSSPASVRSSVVLPEPFGPTRATTSPARARQRDALENRPCVPSPAGEAATSPQLPGDLPGRAGPVAPPAGRAAGRTDDLRLSGRTNLPAVDGEQPVGGREQHLESVFGHHDRPAVAGQVAAGSQHGARACRVELGSGLVEGHDPGPQGQDGSQLHALAFAAGESGQATAPEMRDRERGQRLRRRESCISARAIEAFSSPKAISRSTVPYTDCVSTSWKTSPTRRASRGIGVRIGSSPSTWADPEIRPPWNCGTSPFSRRSRVDLPPPDPPATSVRPGSISRSTSRRDGEPAPG